MRRLCGRSARALFFTKRRHRVFAKIIGVVIAIIILLLYFKWRSADPVLETMIGILLSLLAGFWAWWAIERRQHRMQDELTVSKDRKPRP